MITFYSTFLLYIYDFTRYFFYFCFTFYFNLSYFLVYFIYLMNDEYTNVIIKLFFFQNRELQIMRRLEHCNIVKLKYFFYSSGDKVTISSPSSLTFKWRWVHYLLFKRYFNNYINLLKFAKKLYAVRNLNGGTWFD